jgi:hypothetical protein
MDSAEVNVLTEPKTRSRGTSYERLVDWESANVTPGGSGADPVRAGCVVLRINFFVPVGNSLTRILDEPYCTVNAGRVRPGVRSSSDPGAMKG